MSVVIVTGSAGLIGSEAAAFFAGLGFDVVGIDNDMRREFFGPEASTEWNRQRLEATLGRSYEHFAIDIRDRSSVEASSRYGSSIALVIHAAAQPSHDWAARDPQMDFTVNANGTLNLLEAPAPLCAEAVFIFTSTNKVYGDTPNRLPLVELETRWEIDPTHTYAAGSARTCRSTRRCTASSARPRWRPTCSCRSTAGTSACARPASAGAA
jgi:CDP-paratose 2-epimerase